MGPELARIAWHGDFLGEGSLARVNRHLARALLARGNVAVIPCGEPSPQPERELGLVPRRREDDGDGDSPLVTLRHRWPAHFMNPASGYDVHIQPWEFGAAPRAWIERLRERADAVWCYSEYVRRIYVEGGIPAERTAVVPLGFDPHVYHPGVEPMPVSSPGACVFLFVGGVVPRKNVGMLIEAFTRAFTVNDEVALLIKENAGLAVYEHAWAAQLRALATRPDIPPIRYLDAQYADADMARLYRMATALVHPYRGEGFGLPVLEAMACGTPVVVTRGGSTDDFVDESTGYLVPATRAALGPEVSGYPLAGEGWWLEPDIAALAAALRHVYERRDAARMLGRAAAARAHAAWTWDHAAQHAEARLADLLAVPARAAAPQRERLSAYALQGSSPHDEDGMLFELFLRLRVPDPFFVELAARDDGASCTAYLARTMGWRGLTVRSVHEVSPQAVPLPLDLLSIGHAAAAAWTALRDCRARVVVVQPGEPLDVLDAAAERLGYARLDTGASPAAIFVRDDLVALAGFATTRRSRAE